MTNTKTPKNRICIRVSKPTFLILDYMRHLNDSTMNSLINAIIETACDEFNYTGYIPKRKNNKQDNETSNEIL